MLLKADDPIRRFGEHVGNSLRDGEPFELAWERALDALDDVALSAEERRDTRAALSSTRDAWLSAYYHRPAAPDAKAVAQLLNGD